MSFFTTSEGENLNASNVTTDYEVSTAMEPIPDGTILKAVPTEVKWAEYEGDRYINVRWDVIDGEFKSRVVFHKIRVCSVKPTQKDKALRMLAAIDANAGGKLMQLAGEPTDMDLAYICNNPMEIRVRIWSMEDENGGPDRTGNWVEAVSSLGSAAPSPAPVNGASSPAPAGEGVQTQPSW